MFELENYLFRMKSKFQTIEELEWIFQMHENL